ncbi:MAG: discoidin domain-containing protein [Thermoguttaceae bacterium]
MRRFLILSCSLICIVLATEAGTLCMAGTPGLTSAQIEADWLHQDEVRVAKTGAKRPAGPPPTVEQDAAGGVDGVKNGQWGFHTEKEDDPWWQVDLGEATSIGRLVLFNRCDGCASRSARLKVLLSVDGAGFTEAYQLDGTTFYGHSDKKPAVVDLAGVKARYVRLLQPGHEWFHLDEVEIYTPDDKRNIALGKPATQSSISEWSARHTDVVAPPELLQQQYAINQVVERGMKLAESLRHLGADVDSQAAIVEQVAQQLQKLPADASGETQRELYMQARWAVRRMTLDNPLVDFDTILFVRRAPPMFPHMSDQFYGWWSKPGGSICLLQGFKGDSPKVRSITEGWDDGTFLRPDLSYDGKKVLFAYCKFYPEVAHVGNKVVKEDLPEDAFYQVFEMNLDGTGIRQLTHGRYDDFDARYLPGGDIIFLSTRKGTSLQVGKASAMATVDDRMCVDSYVRCGGGNSRPVAVFTLHRMTPDGKQLQAISAFENFEWTPSIMADGRIVYARWDYIDRFNGPFISLWSTNPDGTNSQLVYGNYTRAPQAVFEAQSIPNSNKLVFTACAHHSNLGGSLGLLDRTYGTELERPITRLTPEVPFPETEGSADSYYVNPHPLSEEFFLVAWSDKRLPGHSRFAIDDPRNPSNTMGIYFYDASGNLEPLYRDPKISCMNPIPVRPRPRPNRLPDLVDWDAPQEGRFLLQDVYQGMGPIERGEIARLRVIGVPPKVQPQMNSPVLGVSAEDPGKFVLGTVPVEEDGSAYFRVPSGVPVLFQAIDRDGLALQTMRSLTYVQPNQTLACIGCHDQRDSTPITRHMPLALLREPSKLTLDPSGSWPLRYDELVQPALDRLCVRCHRPDSDDAKAAALDLTPSKSYDNLLSYADNDLQKLSFERDRSYVGDMPARQSKLFSLLTEKEGHAGIQLDTDARQRLITWMDTYAHRQGSFSPEQEEQLRKFRVEMAEMLLE